MCDAVGESDMIPRRKAVPNKLCIKCKTSKPIVLLRNIRYCKPCFLFAFEGKFRTILNKASCTNDRNCKNMLIGFSGGPSSRAMLKLIYEYTFKHNKYGTITVGYIDESIVSKDKKCEIEAIEMIAKSYNFEFKYVKLEESFPSEEEFLAHFSSIKTATSKEDSIEALKTSLLLKLAKDTSSSMLLLGDCSTRIAIKTIALTAKGRGFSLPFEIGAEAAYYQNITILRPMRDSLAKEVAMFNYFNYLTYPKLSTFSSTLNPKSSITKLTEQFIIGLDRDFPSTVSTVVRTANKLQPSDKASGRIWCPYCLTPSELDIDDWKKAAMVLSLNEHESTKIDPVAETFCYGCRSNFEIHILEDKFPLPLHTINQLDVIQRSRSDLKSQIQEYLIDDE